MSSEIRQNRTVSDEVRDATSGFIDAAQEKLAETALENRLRLAKIESELANARLLNAQARTEEARAREKEQGFEEGLLAAEENRKSLEAVKAMLTKGAISVVHDKHGRIGLFYDPELRWQEDFAARTLDSDDGGAEIADDRESPSETAASPEED